MPQKLVSSLHFLTGGLGAAGGGELGVPPPGLGRDVGGVGGRAIDDLSISLEAAAAEAQAFEAAAEAQAFEAALWVAALTALPYPDIREALACCRFQSIYFTVGGLGFDAGGDALIAPLV